MCAEASTVLRVVAEDFFFNCWYSDIPSDNRIRHIPRCVHYHAQGLRLESQIEIYVYLYAYLFIYAFIPSTCVIHGLVLMQIVCI
jgi:hypothetical protein